MFQQKLWPHLMTSVDERTKSKTVLRPYHKLSDKEKRDVQRRSQVLRGCLLVQLVDTIGGGVAKLRQDWMRHQFPASQWTAQLNDVLLMWLQGATISEAESELDRVTVAVAADAALMESERQQLSILVAKVGQSLLTASFKYEEMRHNSSRLAPRTLRLYATPSPES